MKEKKCKGCKVTFSLERKNFYIDRSSRDGYKHTCITCSKNKVKIRKVTKNGYKFCSKCKSELPGTTEYFLKQKSNKSGLSSQCKECKHEYYLLRKNHIRTKAKKYYEENKELVLEKQMEYNRKNKERKKEYDKEYAENNKGKIQKYQKEYTTKNKEVLIGYRKKHYKKNKERIYETNRLWREKNKDRVRVIRNRRKSRSAGVKSTLTIEQWELIKQNFDYKCAYCGEVKHLEQDHFIPLSKGGEYTRENIIPACRSCNASKNNSDFVDWYKMQETYEVVRETKILNHLQGVDTHEKHFI